MALTPDQVSAIVSLWSDPGTVLTHDNILNRLRMVPGVGQDRANNMLRDALNEGLLYVDRIQWVVAGYWFWIGLTYRGQAAHRQLQFQAAGGGVW